MAQKTSNELFSLSSLDELKEYVKYCKTVLDFINDIVILLSPTLKIKLVNNFAISYYHLKIKNIIEKNFSEIEDLSTSFNIIIKKLKLLNSTTLPFIKFNTTESNKQNEQIQWIGSYLANQRNLPIGIILIGKINTNDISEKRINYLQNCLETIIDNVPGDIYWKNKQGIYLGCNTAMVKKARLKTKLDIIGKTDNELWPDCTFLEHDNEVMALDKIIKVQEQVSVSGENLYFTSIKAPLKDENNQIIGIVGNSLDVTELVNAREKAEEANNIKTQFLLNMQHDLKTPLSNIIGLANILNAIEDLPKKTKKFINYMKISSERLMDLIVDILQYTNLETNHNLEWKFNLKELIQKTIELHIISIRQKNLEIIIDYNNDVPIELVGDRDKIHKILLNLFDNALKFTEHGTIKITIKIVKVIDYPKVILELSIEDTGIGIPEDKYEAIFDRFMRLSPTSSNLYKGIGLGLWTVKQLIKDINGEIYVTSKIGEGSKFSCIFPCKRALIDG